jgi:hypothetical protein
VINLALENMVMHLLNFILDYISDCKDAPFCSIQTAVGCVRDARPNSTNQPLSRQAQTRMRAADKPVYGAPLAAR